MLNASAQGDQEHFQSGTNRQFFDGRATKKMSSKDIVLDLNLP